MGKKPDEGGAPAYMGLFTSLMTVLLAFFILLVAMADTQDAGFYKGVGAVENSLGITGGFGIMPFAKVAGDRGVLGVEVDGEETSIKDKQLIQDVTGEGGDKTTDIENAEEIDRGSYIRMQIPHAFEPGLSKVKEGSKLFEYLRNISVGFFNLKEKVIIRVYAEDTKDREVNKDLAFKRAYAILKVMKKNGMRDNQVEAVGYGFDRYFDLSQVRAYLKKHKHVIYLYIYRKKKN